MAGVKQYEVELMGDGTSEKLEYVGANIPSGIIISACVVCRQKIAQKLVPAF